MNNISSTLKAKMILEECKKNNKKIYNYGLGKIQSNNRNIILI